MVSIRQQKVQGSDLIELLRTSIVATEVEGGGTSVDIVRQLEATATSEEDPRSYVQDLYADLVAACAGDDLPSFE